MRFLGDAKSPCDFIAGDSILRVGYEPYTREPFVQPERRILEMVPVFSVNCRLA